MRARVIRPPSGHQVPIGGGQGRHEVLYLDRRACLWSLVAMPHLGELLRCSWAWICDLVICDHMHTGYLAGPSPACSIEETRVIENNQASGTLARGSDQGPSQSKQNISATVTATGVPDNAQKEDTPSVDSGPPPSSANSIVSPAPLNNVELSDQAADRLLQEEEIRRKQRRSKKGRIQELQEVGHGWGFLTPQLS
jgi:hypothetical protein